MAKASLSSLGEDSVLQTDDLLSNGGEDKDIRVKMAARMQELRKVLADPTRLNQSDQHRLKEYRDLLDAARKSLPVPFREDGPPLGFEFDDVPGDSFFHAQDLPAADKSQGKRRKSGEDDPDFDAKRARLDAEQQASQLQKEHERLVREQQRMAARLAKEHEREVLRLEAERRKQYERILKERKREEERRIKEEARMRLLAEREERRIAAAREKELRAAAKLQEKLNRQKERDLLRRGMRQGALGDAELEWDALMREYRMEYGIPMEVSLSGEGGEAPPGYPPLPKRPEFPPPETVPLEDAAPTGITDELFGTLLSCWSMLHTFADMLGLSSDITVSDFVAEIIQGSSTSDLVSKIHIALLRLLQADAEEAHATREGMKDADVRAHREREAAGIYDIHTGAWLLEEAWAWGFDVDSWRAHLNPMTWPEIAREMAIAAGLGRRRPRRRRRRRNWPVYHNLDGRMGKEGEDLVQMGDKLSLQLPERLGANTLKGAAWLVLQDAGYEGLRVDEIAELIQLRGLRDLSNSKTPDTSINGSLAKDVLFVRIAPATFALQSIREHYEKLGIPGPSTKKGSSQKEDANSAHMTKEEDEEEKDHQKTEGEGDAASDDGENDGKDAMNERDDGMGKDEEEENNDEDEDEAEEEARQRRDEAHEGEPWVALLRDEEYDSLSLEHRIALLHALCQLALESPTLKDVLDRRSEEQQRIRKIAFDESRAEATIQKQLRLQEQTERNRIQVEEAQRKLDMLRGMADEQREGSTGVSIAQGVISQHVERGKHDTFAMKGSNDLDINNRDSKIVGEEEGQPGESLDPKQSGGRKDSQGSASCMDLAYGSILDDEAIEKRSQARHKAIEAAMNSNIIRMEPLGTDRRYNRYWLLVSERENSAAVKDTVKSERSQDVDARLNDSNTERGDASNQKICSGHLLLERDHDGSMKLIQSVEGLEELMASLNRRWPRESALFSALKKHRAMIVACMPSPKFALSSRELAMGNLTDVSSISRRYPEKIVSDRFGKEFLDQLQYDKAPLRKLKLDLLALASSLPSAAFSLAASEEHKEEEIPVGEEIEEDISWQEGTAGRNTSVNAEAFDLEKWQQKVVQADSTASLRTCLGHLETAINPAYLHPEFAKDPALVRGAWIPIGEEVAVALPEIAERAKNSKSKLGVNSGLGMEVTAADAAAMTAALTPLTGDDVVPSDGGLVPLAWLPPTVGAVSLRICSLDASLRYEGPESIAYREQAKNYSFILRPRNVANVVGELVESFPLHRNGRVLPTLFPPFCHRLLFSPRVEFSFPVVQFEADVQADNDAPVDPNSLGTRIVKGPGAVGGRKGGRPRGARNRSMRVGGTGGPGAGRRGGRRGQRKGSVGPGGGRSSVMASRDQDDEDRHYGTDFEEADQMEEDEDIARQLAPEIAAGIGRSFHLQGKKGSVVQSTGPDDDSSSSESSSSESSSSSSSSSSDSEY